MAEQKTSPKQILLIDDEKGIRNVLRITMEAAGFTVIPAPDGESGLSMFHEHLPEIVVTDIKMPGIDGIEVLKKIKQARPETEVIMITGHGDLDLAVKSLKHEAADFITKPIDVNVLEAALKKAEERIAISSSVKEYMEDLEGLIREKNRELNESKQLISIGRTIAGMSHAIKNIAGGLKGSSFILEQGIELGNQQYLTYGWEMVKGNINKITKLSLDLLNYAKTSRLKFVPTDPHLPARDVVSLMEPAAQKQKISLVLIPCPGISPAMMDPDAIHECLLNLVTNAIEAFASVSDRKDRQVTLSVSGPDPGTVRYTVTDNGAGISPSVQDAIFNHFITTKGSGGTGFGLMITQKIVSDHNGTIRFENKTGSGAQFIMELPLKRRRHKNRS
jgi:signal transduction histidine kinase